MFRKLMLFWILSLMGTWEVRAQSREELVASSTDGGFPFMLVFEDAQGGSKRAPGIYVRGEGGSWDPAFLGKVLPKPVSGGVSARLEMAAYTELHEILVIRDGRIHMLNVGSRENAFNTYLVFGEGDAALRHPVSGDLIQVPVVEDVNDVSFYTEDLLLDDINAQLILVSIKSKRVPTGDGLTFAVLVEIKESPASGEKSFKLLYQPTLLEWKFLDRTELSDRVINKKGEAELVSSLSTIPFLRAKSNEPDLLKAWRRLMKDYREQKIGLVGVRRGLMGLETKEISLEASYPYIDSVSGDIEIRELPKITFDLFGEKAFLVLDPEGKYTGIHLNEETDFARSLISDAKPFIAGQPQMTPQNRVKLEISREKASGEQGTHNQVAILRMMDGRVLMLVKRENEDGDPEVVEIVPTNKEYANEVPTEFAWHFSSTGNFLVCSWKYEDETHFTSAYRFGFDGPRVNLLSEATLVGEYFKPAELRRRLIKDDKIIAFDHTTPTSESDDEYAANYRKTGLHIDLTRSLSKKRNGGELSLVFLEPLSTKAVTSNLVFKTFEKVEGLEDKTGIYLVSGTKEENERAGEPFLRGALLLPKAVSSEVLSSMILETGQKEVGDVDVSMVMVDPSNRSNKTGILYLAFNPMDGKSPTTQVSISKRPIAPDSLLLAGFINPVSRASDKDEKGKGKDEKESAKKFQKPMLVAFHVKKDFRGEPGGIVISEIQYQKTHANGIEVPSARELFIEGLDLPANEIQNRILFDDNNDAYWIKTADLDRKNDRFLVTRVMNGKDFYPNRDRSVRLRSLKEEPQDKDREFLRGSWRMSDAIPYGDKEAAIKRDWYRNAPEYQTDVFPEMRKILDELADADRPARHVVLLVPEDLLSYALNYPWALRYRDGSRPDSWSSRNEHHQVFVPRENLSEARMTQGEVMRNLVVMRELGTRRRSMLVAALDRVRQMDRPVIDDEETKSKDAFQITNPRVRAVEINWGTNQTESNNEKDTPHALYLLANEGAKIDLPQFAPRKQPKTTSMLFVGTRKQWEQTLQSAQAEESYGLSSDFEILELGAPTTETRIRFAMENVIGHAVVRSLNYKPSLTGLVPSEREQGSSEEENYKKLMEYLVNRAEVLAKDNKMPVFESFMKVLNELVRQLTQNEKYRSKRTIDRAVIEKVLARVYPMPLNLSVLDEDDPLKILSRDDADFLWLRAGYAGPMAFKERIIKAILAQLATDDVRSLKSSAIIYGPSGSSKTRAVRTLFQALMLKMYRFDVDGSENDSAWGFELNMGRILDPKTLRESGASTEKMISFEEARRHLDTFLSGENGARGFIFLDDMHLAPDEVKAYFLKRIRSLQDEKTYRTLKNVERPTRNITVLIALNLIDTPERIKKFAKFPQYPTDAELILATLSSGDGSNDMERSYLTRWGDLVNLGRFPASSKGPALLSVLSSARQTGFANSHKIVFVNPSVIELMIENSPHADARTFLSAASSGIMRLPRGDFNLFVISNRKFKVADTPKERSFDEFSLSGGDEGQQIQEFARKKFQAISIEDGHAGKLELLKYLIANFRLKVFELILQSVSENREFMKSQSFRQQLVLPLSLAIHRHLTEEPDPFLEDLVLNPEELGITSESQRQLFERELEQAVSDQQAALTKPRKKLGIGEAPRSNILFSLGIGERQASTSRRHVLASTVGSLTDFTNSVMSSIMHVPDVRSISDPQAWLGGKFEDKKIVDDFSQAIASQLTSYYASIFDSRVQNVQGMDPLTFYEAMRFFVLSVDRAISRMHWGQILGFSVEALKIISRDMSVGQSPQVQNLLFKINASPFTPTDKGLVLGLAKSLPHFDDYSATESGSWNPAFTQNCSTLLSITGEILP